MSALLGRDLLNLMSAERVETRPIDIIVPFYKNAQLVAPLFQSLAQLQDELAGLCCSIIAINDSPDDRELERCLRGARDALSSIVPCELKENEQNIGFVQSVNNALSKSLAQRHDVLLLNSDTIVFPGAVTEIRKTAYRDPMIGFVSPRSNNATICSLPHQEEFRALEPAESHAIFLELSRYLPDFHFVPTAVGFCLFIKFEILDEFGLFDGVYGQGYNEENDLIMRANRCGYRAALANHAFVYHIGESSFSVSESPKQVREETNAALLSTRYPEYISNIGKYLESAHYQAECLLTGLLPDRDGRLDLLFDFSSVGPYYNGTFEASKEILSRAVNTWGDFNIHVMVSEEAKRFHGLDRLERVFFVPADTGRKFALAFRFGQPFEHEQLLRMSRIAALNVYGMLDPIAFDCLYLNGVDLDAIWGTVFNHADGVIYISDFVREQFHRRFRVRPGLHEKVAYLSLDCADYPGGNQPQSAPGSYILIIGNAFAHKRVPATVDALSHAFPREKIVVIGLRDDSRQNVISYQSGDLSKDRMEQLMRGASFVVFPSTYEGFGIPVVESLAYGKPVLARSIPVMHDIRGKLDSRENLILYSSTRELIERLKQGFPKWHTNGARPGEHRASGWDVTTQQVGNLLREVVHAASFQDVLVPRLLHMRLLERQHSEQISAILRQREAWIQEIYRSWSWRLTAPIRQIGGAFLRMRGKQ